MADIKLLGRVFITADIEAVTGLHIGGSNMNVEIGGLDKTVVRNPLTNRPYIPGSSLRGKMRSLTEKRLGLKQNNKIGQVTIHTCKKQDEYNTCKVCQVFGVPAEVDATGPTRLLVRDVQLSDDSARKLDAANTQLPYAEWKTEVAIDRVTSAATPRNLERVPAGAVFSDAELVYSLFSEQDYDQFKLVIEALQQIEDDYIGGAGSRGSGKVRFINIKVYARNSDDYSTPHPIGEYNSVQTFADDWSSVLNSLKAAIK